jgi:uncharacterized membrane protein YraQ (UPF0718 family)
MVSKPNNGAASPATGDDALSLVAARHYRAKVHCDSQHTDAAFRVRRVLLRAMVHSCLVVFIADRLYSYYNGITFLTRDQCILYLTLTPVGFLFYEYFVELGILLVVGIFAAAVIENRLRQYKKFLPRHPVSAFAYGSILPLCACGAIPLAGSMYPSIPMRALVTFLISAPLLNPYIIGLSVSVLGWQYALLRVGCSMALAISCGYLVEVYHRWSDSPELPMSHGCVLAGHCGSRPHDVYETTYANVKKVLPFVLIAGVFGMTVELIDIGDWINRYQPGSSTWGAVLVVLAGIPIYFCNGADVLFLKPLVFHKILPVGTAMAFSLTSTSICVTSIVLLAKFLGRKLTLVMVATVIVVSLLLSGILNMCAAAFQ